MEQRAELISCAISLILKSLILSARLAGVMRWRLFKAANLNAEKLAKEVHFLRDKIAELESRNAILCSQLKARKNRRHLTVRERLAIIWHIEYFKIPKCRCAEYFGIARSTLDRWLRVGIGGLKAPAEPANKTPLDVVALVWEIASANPWFGKLRIAQQLALLNIFLAASTIRNILRRPRPRNCATARKTPNRKAPGTGIVAEYPNHVWSADLTTVRLWGFWRVHVFVAIDHFSRKLIAAEPLMHPSTACVIGALDKAFALFGPPSHLITDQGSVFTAANLERFLSRRNVEHILGAVGEHGSISKTERVIGSLKREWFRRVTLIRGFDHLAELCESAVRWYNQFRPHQALAGNRPTDVYLSGRVVPFAPIDRDKFKSVPIGIERVQFAEPRTTAWRLDRCA